MIVSLSLLTSNVYNLIFAILLFNNKVRALADSFAAE